MQQATQTNVPNAVVSEPVLMNSEKNLGQMLGEMNIESVYAVWEPKLGTYCIVLRVKVSSDDNHAVFLFLNLSLQLQK
jgi:hypothetical protein